MCTNSQCTNSQESREGAERGAGVKFYVYQLPRGRGQLRNMDSKRSELSPSDWNILLVLLKLLWLNNQHHCFSLEDNSENL